MQKVNIELEQTWDSLDDAIDYFLDVVLDLKALKRLPEPPKELYLKHYRAYQDFLHYDDLTITLTNL